MNLSWHINNKSQYQEYFIQASIDFLFYVISLKLASKWEFFEGQLETYGLQRLTTVCQSNGKASDWVFFSIFLSAHCVSYARTIFRRIVQ